MGAKVLVVGGGGREHALGWKIAQSEHVSKVFCAPGNAGTVGESVAIGVKDFPAQIEFCVEQGVTMVVVGPEDPLCAGIHDAFAADERTKDVVVVGPKKAGATLEGSKSFSKEFMAKHKVPTAAYKAFTKDTVAEGKAFLATLSPPFVLKADGLAAGKGVLIEQTLEAAEAGLDEMVSGKFGSASVTVVIEEYLHGDELTVFALIDAKGHFKILPTSCDFKRAGDGDTGLNTGGMGAVSPCPFAAEGSEFMKIVEETVVVPTVKGLVSDNLGYVGFLYFGLMNCAGKPFVVEFNARMGDPETEVVMPRIQNDLYPLLASLKDGTLDKHTVEYVDKKATAVILASGGYPASYPKGLAISGLEEAAKGALVFHAGTKVDGDNVVTSGGRVLAVVGLGESVQEATDLAYAGVKKIQWDGVYYRNDIAKKFL
eukprot:Rhum_TRINITY_DN6197_c0_g1::Rhum_TRINITY_DN6197_c0_g1_i1::g.19329::m.19329/K01945/purD; phosphoribosylamine--glycine ligase